MDEFDLSQLTPDQIEMLLSMGTIDEEQAELARQLTTAEELRYREGPRGRHTRGAYVAANPLEHLAGFMEKRGAKKDMARIGTEQEGLRGEKVEGRKAFLDLLRGGQRQPEGAMTFPMPGTEQQAPGAGQMIESDLPAQPAPPAPLPQAPAPNIPPGQPINVPQDQFTIDAAGGTQRGQGNVSVGDIPPPGMAGLAPEEMQKIVEWLRTQGGGAGAGAGGGGGGGW